MRRTKKRLALCLTAALCIVLCLLIGYVLVKQNAVPHTVTVTENTIGTLKEIGYELWKDEGEAEMVVYDTGRFECRWADTHDAVFRIGRKFYTDRTASSFGVIDLRYEADYEAEGDSYLGAYGWMTEPLAEYYIIENWGKSRPGELEILTALGSCTIGGVEYDLYSSLRKNKPNALGTENATFMQYWSVRRTPATEGTIRVTDHFRAWEEAGLPVGNIYEISFAAEGMYGSGRADVRLGADFWEALAG